tara:strand:+ start:485 stop:910 length:426 start_codon:yes stop_codon:yes gene_type:complete
MTFNEILEYILITAIIVVMSFVFFYDKEDVVDIREEPTMEEFYAFPLQAWMDTDIKGDIVKVRYLVDRENTKLYMFDKWGSIVHKQHISLSPHKDGRERVETYVWKLYRTEWTDRIGAGQYQIVVGTTYDKHGDSVEITIP